MKNCIILSKNTQRIPFYVMGFFKVEVCVRHHLELDDITNGIPQAQNIINSFYNKFSQIKSFNRSKIN